VSLTGELSCTGCACLMRLLLRADTEYLKTIRDDQGLQNGNVPGAVPSFKSPFPRGPDLLIARSGAAASPPATSDRADGRAPDGGGGHTDISWSAAYPLITHWVLKYYGDEAVVKEHWPTLNLYMNGLMEGTEGIPAFWTWGDCETGIVVCIRHSLPLPRTLRTHVQLQLKHADWRVFCRVCG
jgi:hypothetical protein